MGNSSHAPRTPISENIKHRNQQPVVHLFVSLCLCLAYAVAQIDEGVNLFIYLFIFAGESMISDYTKFIIARGILNRSIILQPMSNYCDKSHLYFHWLPQ